MPWRRWHQISIRFDDPGAAERAAIAHFGPALTTAESHGLIISWFFIRKPWWRFRYLSLDGGSESEAKTLIAEAAHSLQAAGHASQWVENIYEPEIHAFGGEEGMEVAHHLFHHDSRRVFEHLGSRPPGERPSDRSERRDLSILLCAALMRSAGQDWYEQGDIWAKVADLRPARNDARSEKWRDYKAALRRLVMVETGSESPLRSAETATFDWLPAFERAGADLEELHHKGLLSRGIRAVISHHVIFHWNRMGLPNRTQAAISHALKEAIFNGD